MARTELPWLMFGRLVRPYALAVSLASASLGVLITSNQSLYGSGPWSHALATLALTAALLLWAGWWWHGTRGDLLMRHGLLLTAAVFAARATYMTLSGQPAAGAFVACWAIASAGAYLLEASDGLHTRHGAEEVRGE